MNPLLWFLGSVIGNSLDPALWIGAFVAAACLRNLFLALLAGVGVGVANDFLVRAISSAYTGQAIGGKIISAVLFTAIAYAIVSWYRQSRGAKAIADEPPSNEP